MSTPAPAIALDGVSFAFGDIVVLEDISLDIPRGEFVGLIGPNGSGKTTLLRIVLGLVPPDRGTVQVLGQSPKRARPKVGYVPQYSRLTRDFPISVREVVMLGRLGSTRLIGGFSKSDREAADEAMRETKVIDLADRPIGALSGGQFQKTLIARALVSQPELLILDEPTANVDTRAEEELFEMLRRLNERATIIVVSHDIGFVTSYATQVACLNRTLICHGAEAVTGEIIQQMYGHPVHMVHHGHAHDEPSP